MSEAKYECFSDPSYFDQWCVREIGERRFGYGFHVPTQAEAMGLCALLNGLTAERDALSAQLRAAGEPVAWLYTFTLPGEYEDAVSEVYRKYQQVSADAPFGMRGHDFDGNAVTTETPLYASPVPQPQEARDVPQCISQHDHRAMQDDAPISFARGWNNCIAAILADKEKK